jgi:hypothetical protein
VHALLLDLSFYDDTVNAARYVKNIPSPFFGELRQEEKLYGVFKFGSTAAGFQ